MEKLTDALTTELREQLKDVYVIVCDSMVAVIPDNEPTADTLKIVDLDWKLSLTAEDFQKDGEYFTYADDEGFISYLDEDNMPEEVAKILNAVIEARNSDKENSEED